MLHRLHHKAKDKPLGERQARHYYDLFRLSNHDAGQHALEDTELLSQVVAHKILFYTCAWAQYSLAVPGSLRLLPPDYRLEELRTDYNKMAEEMIFGDVPEFSEIIDGLRETEAAFNRPRNE